MFFLINIFMIIKYYIIFFRLLSLRSLGGKITSVTAEFLRRRKRGGNFLISKEQHCGAARLFKVVTGE